MGIIAKRCMFERRDSTTKLRAAIIISFPFLSAFVCFELRSQPGSLDRIVDNPKVAGVPFPPPLFHRLEKKSDAR